MLWAAGLRFRLRTVLVPLLRAKPDAAEVGIQWAITVWFIRIHDSNGGSMGEAAAPGRTVRHSGIPRPRCGYGDAGWG